MSGFKLRIGSRAQVMHGTAKMTNGGLTKKQLKYNKRGKIVSRKASKSAKKSKNLIKAGYITRKGTFGIVQKKGGMRKGGAAAAAAPAVVTASPAVVTASPADETILIFVKRQISKNGASSKQHFLAPFEFIKTTDNKYECKVELSTLRRRSFKCLKHWVNENYENVSLSIDRMYNRRILSFSCSREALINSGVYPKIFLRKSYNIKVETIPKVFIYCHLKDDNGNLYILYHDGNGMYLIDDNALVSKKTIIKIVTIDNNSLTLSYLITSNRLGTIETSKSSLNLIKSDLPCRLLYNKLNHFSENVQIIESLGELKSEYEILIINKSIALLILKNIKQQLTKNSDEIVCDTDTVILLNTKNNINDRLGTATDYRKNINSNNKVSKPFISENGLVSRLDDLQRNIYYILIAYFDITKKTKGIINYNRNRYSFRLVYLNGIYIEESANTYNPDIILGKVEYFFKVNVLQTKEEFVIGPFIHQTQAANYDQYLGTGKIVSNHNMNPSNRYNNKSNNKNNITGYGDSAKDFGYLRMHPIVEEHIETYKQSEKVNLWRGRSGHILFLNAYQYCFLIKRQKIRGAPGYYFTDNLHVILIISYVFDEDIPPHTVLLLVEINKEKENSPINYNYIPIISISKSKSTRFSAQKKNNTIRVNKSNGFMKLPRIFEYKINGELYRAMRNDSLPNKSSLIRKLKGLDLSNKSATLYSNDPHPLDDRHSLDVSRKNVTVKLKELKKYDKTTYIPRTYYDLELRNSKIKNRKRMIMPNLKTQSTDRVKTDRVEIFEQLYDIDELFSSNKLKDNVIPFPYY